MRLSLTELSWSKEIILSRKATPYRIPRFSTSTKTNPCPHPPPPLPTPHHSILTDKERPFSHKLVFLIFLTNHAPCMAKVYEPVPLPEWRLALNYNVTVFQNLTICFCGILTIFLVNSVAFSGQFKTKNFFLYKCFLLTYLSSAIFMVVKTLLSMGTCHVIQYLSSTMDLSKQAQVSLLLLRGV